MGDKKPTQGSALILIAGLIVAQRNALSSQPGGPLGSESVIPRVKFGANGCPTALATAEAEYLQQKTRAMKYSIIAAALINTADSDGLSSWIWMPGNSPLASIGLLRRESQGAKTYARD
jgi:hypothetical protein